MDFLSFFFALSIAVIGVVLSSHPGSMELTTLVFPIPVTWFLHLTFVSSNESTSGRLTFSNWEGVWTEADFARVGNRRTHRLQEKQQAGLFRSFMPEKNRPDVGIMALDTKGDLSEPLESVAKELKCKRISDN